MTDPSAAERLAALQARRRPDAPAQTPTLPMAVEATDQAGPAPARRLLDETTDGGPDRVLVTPPADGVRLRPTLDIAVPWNRVAATGASVVSFAAMVVAMGPMFVGEATTATAAVGDATDPASGVLPLTAPSVEIEVAKGAQPASGAADAMAVGDATAIVVASTGPDSVTPGPEGTSDPSVVGTTPPTAPPADAPGATAPPSTAVPTTAAPNTAAPTSAEPATVPPSTGPAPTVAPTTPPPTTAAPTTPAPTTAPPTTVAPTTQPPTTQASGG